MININIINKTVSLRTWCAIHGGFLGFVRVVGAGEARAHGQVLVASGYGVADVPAKGTVLVC